MTKDNFISSGIILTLSCYFAALIFIVIVSYSCVYAQKSNIDRDDFDRLAKTPSFTAHPASGKVLLEKTIDPKSYILGPGDILSVFIWGNFQGQFTLPVSPEGMLLVPEIGPVAVSGYSLEKAAKIISDRILDRYRNVEIVVSLVNLRVFKVFVGGAVKKPGAFPATPISRVSELIDMAGGFLGYDSESMDYKSDFKGSKFASRKASKRNVIIYRENGDVLEADILRFQITGKTKYNLQLTDADNVFVPLQDRGINLYGIFGAVKNPGYFEYSKRDSLRDLFELAHGLALNADSNNVEIVRFQADNEKTFSFTTDLRKKGWNIALQADDRIYIKELQNYHEKHQVKLVGEFKFPGYYAIVPDSTWLSGIIDKAGGFTDFASLHEAEMFRISAEEIIDPEFERLKKMEVADMTESEYQYFKMKSRSKPGRVSVDFPALIDGDKSKDFILRNGDLIQIPRKSRVINVMGEVSNPGIMPLSSGADYRYYIEKAGGFSDRANKRGVSIIKGLTGEWKKAEKGKLLEPGDTIWISEKKKHDYWGFFKETLIFVGNIATVFLVIQQATK